MLLSDLKKIIPEAETVKDNFGGDYYYIPYSVLSKRKAWNLYIKKGFLPCLNRQYLKKDNIYLYNSSLKNYLIITVDNNIKVITEALNKRG